jgi:hypothetical protein
MEEAWVPVMHQRVLKKRKTIAEGREKRLKTSISWNLMNQNGKKGLSMLKLFQHREGHYKVRKKHTERAHSWETSNV